MRVRRTLSSLKNQKTKEKLGLSLYFNNTTHLEGVVKLEKEMLAVSFRLEATVAFIAVIMAKEFVEGRKAARVGDRHAEHM